jgi:hypothetical protein
MCKDTVAFRSRQINVPYTHENFVLIRWCRNYLSPTAKWDAIGSWSLDHAVTLSLNVEYINMNIETAVKFPTGTLSSPTRSYGNWSFSLLFNCFTHGKDRRKLFVIDTPSYLFSFEHLKNLKRYYSLHGVYQSPHLSRWRWGDIRYYVPLLLKYKQ